PVVRVPAHPHRPVAPSALGRPRRVRGSPGAARAGQWPRDALDDAHRRLARGDHQGRARDGPSADPGGHDHADAGGVHRARALDRGRPRGWLRIAGRCLAVAGETRMTISVLDDWPLENLPLDEKRGSWAMALAIVTEALLFVSLFFA